MSKYITEIIKDLRDNPETFKDYEGCGVQKEDIVVCQYGNTRSLSVISVLVNGKSMPTTYIDLWRLEVAIGRWYKTISLDVIRK